MKPIINLGPNQTALVLLIAFITLLTICVLVSAGY